MRVERMLRVDEGRRATTALHGRDGVQGQRGLPRSLRAVDLHDAAARIAADAEREIERERPARDGIDLVLGVRTELHDRAFTELLLDLQDRLIDRPGLL